MSIKITYFVHGTTTDNEKEISSGWYDVDLSDLGIQQSIELWDKIKDDKFDAVFCSDLKRAVHSAELTFKDRVEIIKDERLRECNYGDYNASPSVIVEPMQEKNITEKFPNSGVLINRLSTILDGVKPSDYKYQEMTLTGILIDIGYNNPGCFPLVAGLMSNYIPMLSKQIQKELLVKIQEKICTLSNIGLLEIWIQRIALGLKLQLDFSEILCKYASGDCKQKIFIADWISDKTVGSILENGVYIEKSIIDKIKPKIDAKEIQVFSYDN